MTDNVSTTAEAAISNSELLTPLTATADPCASSVNVVPNAISERDDESIYTAFLPSRHRAHRDALAIASSTVPLESPQRQAQVWVTIWD